MHILNDESKFDQIYFENLKNKRKKENLAIYFINSNSFFFLTILYKMMKSISFKSTINNI